MFKASAIRAMQPTRMLFMRQSQQRFVHQSPQLFMRQTVRMMRPVPKEEQGAHTVSQRLRSLKKIPAELIPLFVVLSVAIGAAIFSTIRKFMTDKNLRLKRQAGRE